MGSDQSRSCMGDDQPGARAANHSSPDKPISKKNAMLKKRGNEIERLAESDDGVDSADEERERRKQRRKGMQEPDPATKKKKKDKGSGSSGSGSGSGSDDEVPGAPLNFNREYEAPANPATQVAGPDNDMQIGVLDDEKYEDALSGPGRERNKGGLGIGDPMSPMASGIGIGEELDEIDAEELRAFAFKTAAAAAGEQLEFEYELPELAERLGSSLKILTAGYDDAVMNVPHQRYTQTYKAYNLHASNLTGGSIEYNDGFGPNGTRRPSAVHMFLDESQNYGAEYKAVEVPFSEEELLLQKAAAHRRRRKIMRELHWQKQKKEAKAAERAAQARKDESERSQTSKSGLSYTRQKSLTHGSSSRRHSFGPSSVRSASRPAFGRASTLGNGNTGKFLASGMASPSNRASMGMHITPNSVRRSLGMASNMASPRG